MIVFRSSSAQQLNLRSAAGYRCGVMSEPFPYDSLRRFPDVEAPNLHAYDASDRLLVERALDSGIAAADVVVVGDDYGAITLRLLAEGWRGVRVHQDLATGREALALNAERLGIRPDYLSGELDETFLGGARLVLMQLPRALAQLEEIADAVARFAHPDVEIIAGGRVKHMTLGMNEALARSFSTVTAERAEQKSRLLHARGASASLSPAYPVSHREEGMEIVAFGGAFAGPRIDIGTRALLSILDRIPDGDALDLGCGTGVLATSYALRHPSSSVIASDRSMAAVRSARETAKRNGVADRVSVVHEDAAGGIADASMDVVLLNPPFHLGASVHAGAALRLFEAAARVLKVGGELWTVYNSHLDYRGRVRELVGVTTVELRTAKFTVTRSVRRSA